MIVRRIGAAPPLTQISAVAPMAATGTSGRAVSEAESAVERSAEAAVGAGTSSEAGADPAGACGEDLITLLAHDIRTPLSTIRVACQLLTRQIDAGNATATDLIGLIEHSLAQINRMIDDVLGLGRPHADASAEPVVSVLRDVAGDFRPLLDLNQIVLDLRIPEVDCHVFMHRASLRSVLSNLISNAIRFTAPGGSVRVAAECQGGRVRFVVTDTGRGISEDELPHVFDRRWHQRREAGTTAGLGLSLVKHIVEAHGGQISVSSRRDHGATFTVDLPAAVPCALP